MIKEDTRAGIYITVIIHLAVIIVLLTGALRVATARNDYLYIELPEARELTPEELEELKELEQEKKELEAALMKEQIRQEVLSGKVPRNMTVDRGRVKDDRNTDVDELEKDRKRVEDAMRDNLDNELQPYQYTPSERKEEKKNERQSSYSGPGMIEFNIPGWTDNYLYPPGYTKYSGGVVTVSVKLNGAGRVISASVSSSSNSSLNEAAVSAAKRSSFTGGPSSGGEGTITYTFIAQ